MGRTLSIPLERAGRTITPRYLDESDYPWLNALLDEYARFVGRRRSELHERMGEPLPMRAPAAKLRVAKRVLDRQYADRVASVIAPERIRQHLFDAAAHLVDRQAAILSTAETLQIDPGALPDAAFADVPGERRLQPLAQPLSPTELALKTNYEMVVGLLRRSTHVSIEAEGKVRALVRAAKLRGLLCTAEPIDGERAVRLEVSGPFALFRRTLLYGKALSSLIPRAAQCHHFALTARCVLSGERDIAEFNLRSGDPVVPAAPLEAFDSKLEEKFASDFGRLAPDWDIVREPNVVDIGDGFIFPDFLLRHRRRPNQSYVVEIVGFWTREYLEKRLESLRTARIDRLILCVDADRNCGDADLPADARIVRFRKRVPAAAVLALIEQQGEAPGEA